MAIGAVDMLIPPSALTVLLGSLSGISISKLLIGGVLPGLILSVAFVLWIVLRVRCTPSLAPATETKPCYTRLGALAAVLLLRAARAVDLRRRGGCAGAGWATPTECAALGAFATLVLAVGYRALTSGALLRGAEGHGGASRG